MEAFFAFAWWGPIAWVFLSLARWQWQSYINISLVIWSFLAIVTWIITITAFANKMIRIFAFAENLNLPFPTIYRAVINYDFPLSYSYVWNMTKDQFLSDLQAFERQELEKEGRNILAARFNRS